MIFVNIVINGFLIMFVFFYDISLDNMKMVLMKKMIVFYVILWMDCGIFFWGFVDFLVVILINFVLEKVKFIDIMVIKMVRKLFGNNFLWFVKFDNIGVFVVLFKEIKLNMVVFFKMINKIMVIIFMLEN